HERVGDAYNRIIRQVIFWITLGEFLRGVDEKQLALTLCRLGFVQHQYNARRRGVVEEIFWQINDAFDEILFNEPTTYVSFPAPIRIAGTTGSRPSVKHNGSAPFLP